MFERLKKATTLRAAALSLPARNDLRDALPWGALAHADEAIARRRATITAARIDRLIARMRRRRDLIADGAHEVVRDLLLWHPVEQTIVVQLDFMLFVEVKR